MILPLESQISSMALKNINMVVSTLNVKCVQVLALPQELLCDSDVFALKLVFIKVGVYMAEIQD